MMMSGEIFAGEQHVLLSVLNAEGSFLSVSTGELVSDLRDSHGSHTDLSELVTLHIECQHDLVHDSGLGVPEKGAGVSLGVSMCLAFQLVVILRQMIVLPMMTSSP